MDILPLYAIVIFWSLFNKINYIILLAYLLYSMTQENVYPFLNVMTVQRIKIF